MRVQRATTPPPCDLFALYAERGTPTPSTIWGSFDDGLGVLQDKVGAPMWFSLSAAQGKDGAAAFRDLIARRMTPGQIAEAQKLAASGSRICSRLLVRVARLVRVDWKLEIAGRLLAADVVAAFAVAGICGCLPLRLRASKSARQCPLLALSGHAVLRCTCPLMTQSGHWPRLEPHPFQSTTAGYAALS